MVKTIIKITLLLAVCVMSQAKAQEPLALMPWPKQVELKQGHFKLPKTLNVSFEGVKQHRADFQLKRFTTHLKRIKGYEQLEVNSSNARDSQLKIKVLDKTHASFPPKFAEDESYTLDINDAGISIQAQTVLGAQHGLTTLVQLLNTAKSRQIRQLSIIDSPRFPWRGLLIDSVRHFISIDTIKRQLSGMASAKLNVLHWHLTDDQGWRVESKLYPKLTEKASDNLFYTQEQIKDVIEYASLLGIRVVPEFGMPGHASAIAVAYPELMASKQAYEMERQWGVFKPLLDVSNPKVYEFVDNLIGEMSQLFPDTYLHIGGDEVEPEHWLENPNIQTLMTKKGLNNGHDIQNYFNQRIQPILQKHNKVMMGWDEVFHPELPKNIVVQSWRGHDSLNAVAKAGYRGILSTGFYIDQPQYTEYHYRNDLIPTQNKADLTLPIVASHQFTITRLKGSAVRGELLLFGQQAMTQALIKLNNNHHVVAKLKKPFNNTEDNRLFLSADSWMGPLQFEFDLSGQHSAVMIGNSRYPIELSNEQFTPHKISLSDTLSEQETKGILGGEATIWSEMVTDDNIDLRIWPRLYAISERLWSQKHLDDSNNMYARLDVMDSYASNTIGLQHKSQQVSGFKQISSTLKDSNKAFAYLTMLSTILEPAHYYTRHHIKYLQNEYHQMAALDLFVDYLPVESKKARELKALITEYIGGDNQALSELEEALKDVQTQLHSYDLKHNAKLGSLVSTVDNLKTFYIKALGVIELCKVKTQHSVKTNHRVEAELLSTQSLQNELVNPLVTPVRNLYMHCQGK